MPLGRDYDWSGAISQYGDYLSNMQPDFWDQLLAMAPAAAMFIPGLGPAAKFGIGSGLEALGSMRQGQVPQPDWRTLLELMQPKSSMEEWLEQQTQQTMGVITGQGPGTGVGALNPFGQALFERGTGLDMDWSGFQKPETPQPQKGSVLEQMRQMYTKQGPQAMRKLYEEGKLSKEVLEFLSKSGYAKMFPGVLPTTATEGAVPKFEQVWHWLGKSAEQTPPGVAVEFKKQGYTVDPETKTWKPPGKEEKPFTTAYRVLAPLFKPNIFGRPMKPTLKLIMQNIKVAEGAASAAGDTTTLGEMRKAREMMGYPGLEDEKVLKEAIKSGDFGTTVKEIKESLKTMQYSDEYIDYILQSFGAKF